MGVIRTERFREHISHTCSFHDSPHWPSCDNPCPPCCRLEHHLPSTIVPYHTMRNRCACQRYRLQAFFGFVYRLANRLGHFIGFPQANTNTASAVTNHHQGTEAKASSTLDDLR